MQLTIHDVAKGFDVSEKTVYRWLGQNALPAYKINDQYRFSRSELLEWAAARKMKVHLEFLSGENGEDGDLPALSDAVKAGGIYYHVGGTDRDIVLRNIVDVMKLPESIDREFIWQILVAREKMASTGIGDGIAIPHVRNPVILNNIPYPVVTLCFLEKPIEFGALDGKPVHCLFSLICPTARIHLHIISRLAFILRDEEFKELVLKHASEPGIINGIERAEARLTGVKKEGAAAEV
ncbi:MAG: PTS fructose transporter subunit IIA [Lentisphaerae bacterium GWF2_44_16]|nr:MAG: PTS fructose transporter subunit IIA [Lentisphaerae bacterium GWF2_44_16]